MTLEAELAFAADVELVADGGCSAALLEPVESDFFTGLGASTPAVPEPRPSFWRLGASSLPLELRPLSDWNFCMAATVFESHLPLGAPW